MPPASGPSRTIEELLREKKPTEVRGQSKPRMTLPAVPPVPAVPAAQNQPMVAGVRQQRALIKHFRVRVTTLKPAKTQRILMSDATAPFRGTSFMTIQDVEYLIGQLQRAIKRAPRAR